MAAEIAEPRTDGAYRLGIDLGSGSIGWAAVLETDGEPTQILAMGVRRFEAGVQGDIEQGKDESRATARRDARGPRRLTWRRQHRLRKVFRLLQQMDLLPPSRDDSHDERHRVLAEFDRQWRESSDCPNPEAAHRMLPYLLRARALDQKLCRHELGRALYHLAQRRGFLSNLKAAKKDEDLGVVKKGISELEQLMQQTGARTLGEYLASFDPEEHRIRGRWTARRMYQDEFEKIWTTQAPHHEHLTDEHKEQLYNAIFHQRPLRSQKGLIGMCKLEPYKRRAPTACLEFQEYRILDRVNLLTVTEPDGHSRRLTAEERSTLLAELAENPELTFGQIRKLFGMKKSREYARNYSFNYEEDGDSRIIGNRTAAKLVAGLRDRWRQMDGQDRKRLVDEVLSFESEEALINRLTTGWGFDASSARAVAQTVFEPGYGSLSRKAISRLLPLLREGIPYATARKQVYGDSVEVDEPLDRLPAKHDCAVLRQLRNPAVERALSELRKVVNALIRRYGRPREIHVELARDLKHSRQRRKSMVDQNKQNEKAKSEVAEKILAEMNNDQRYCTPRNVLKARLAEECNRECPYTGRSISMEALVGDRPQFDIEHIIPFSRSGFDNSFFNKTLCYIDENRKRKQNRTPFEAYHAAPQWDEILARVRRFQGDARVRRRKLELFQREKLDTEEFNARQLNDTRYMSRLAGDYLGLLFGGQIDAQGKRRVQVSAGRVTAYLRGRWNLNSILGEPEQKERADHRHHAVDALVVALTGAREVQLLSRAAEEAENLGLTGLFPRGEDAFDPPWDGFLDQARQAVDAIHVSSRVSRKLVGKLHKETIFSKPKPAVDKHGRPVEVHHLRKQLKSLSANEVADIVDDRIRVLVEQKLLEIGGTPDKAFADANNHPYMKDKDGRIIKSKDGRIIPIHKVRIRRSDKPMTVGQGSKQRYVNPGSNHHMEIVAVLDTEGKEKKWEGDIVSTFEAVGRHSRGEPIIRRDHGHGKRFKFSLAGDEHVEMELDSGRRDLYRVVVISGNQVEFRLHTDARPSTLVKKIPGSRVRLSADSLRKAKARKVAVDPLGNVFPAND